MSYGYGGRANPYDQRGDAAPQYQQPAYGGAPAQSYGRQQYNNAPAMGRDGYAGQNVEMAPLAQNGSQFGRQQDPNQILNACRDVDNGIEEIKSQLKAIQNLQRAALTDPNGKGDRQVEAKASEILAMYRELTGRVKSIKQLPESGAPRNAPQVGRVDRLLKETYKEYLNIDQQFRQRSEEQSARQYRIVRPDASEAEVRQAVENPDNQQVFQQAMMSSNRQGQAKSTMNAVRSRHEAIQNIERQMVELAQLFNDMDNLVVQQEAAVTAIELKGEEVVENMDKGNQEIGTAIVHARNTRKWKWWCLGISVLIIIIIVVVILIYKFVIQGGTTTVVNKTSNNKRFVLPDLSSLSSHRVLSGQPWSSKPVVPGVEWVPGAGRKIKRFIA